jgi:hypothetical protein
MNRGRDDQRDRIPHSIVTRGCAWPLVGILALSILLLTACQQETEEPRPLPPPQLADHGALTMDASTVASIYLPGLPPEMRVDEAGQVVVASGLENVGVGTIVLLRGGGEGVRPEAIASYRWTLEGPPGSGAQLDDPTSRTPSFIPDVAGWYEVGLTIADEGGVAGQPASLSIRAGTWVGNGAVTAAPDNPYQCDGCHAEKINTWRGTRHAITLRRAMDGQASPFYLENCIHCHTVGKNALADNGGFDDVARELNWSYPEELKVGNYAALVRDYPRLADLGNTQCEMCHGPGSGHEDDDDNIAVSLRPELCIQCHDFLQQDQHAQWARSGHADTSLPQLFPEGIDNPTCSSCHTTKSFIAAADGAQIEVGGDEYLSCQACHDAHAAPGANSYQVRYFGSIQLPDGTNMMNMGSSALCIHCHTVGETPEWVEHEYDPLVPPPQSAAPEMLAGVGGYTYGETLDNSPHVNAVQWSGACVTCHMVSSTGEGVGDFLSATMNEPVGEHTFQVRWDNGTPEDPADDYQNLNACSGCHGEVPRINGPAGADYDGDGQTEGVQDEVQGLLNLVRDELMAAGVAWSDVAPYWGPAATEGLRAGVYNWSYVNNDGSRGVHNTARAVELLQLTYRQLAGQEVPGAALRAEQAPELTFQDRFATERSPLEGLAWCHIVIPLALLGLLGALVYLVLAAVRTERRPSASDK